MFSDFDIRNHLRSIGLSNGKMAADYRAIGIPDTEHKGEGKVPHMAGLRAKNQAVYTLADVGKSENGSLRKLHWARTYEVEK